MAFFTTTPRDGAPSPIIFREPSGASVNPVMTHPPLAHAEEQPQFLEVVNPRHLNTLPEDLEVVEVGFLGQVAQRRRGPSPAAIARTLRGTTPRPLNVLGVIGTLKLSLFLCDDPLLKKMWAQIVGGNGKLLRTCHVIISTLDSGVLGVIERFQATFVPHMRLKASIVFGYGTATIPAAFWHCPRLFEQAAKVMAEINLLPSPYPDQPHIHVHDHAPAAIPLLEMQAIYERTARLRAQLSELAWVGSVPLGYKAPAFTSPDPHVDTTRAAKYDHYIVENVAFHCTPAVFGDLGALGHLTILPHLRLGVIDEDLPVEVAQTVFLPAFVDSVTTLHIPVLDERVQRLLNFWARAEVDLVPVPADAAAPTQAYLVNTPPE